ncbi:MAG: sodium-dependent transporter [Lentisphaerae bacterium]|nr:sodium-dependent transporter [Lentisphaerota bacterium]
MENQREHFASRLGFIFMTAGCAIGLGNVWRFPYVAGANGGGLFVLLYFACLLFFGLPILLMELSLGRAGQSTFPGAFRKLQNPASRFKWQIPAYVLFSGNLILLMFYTVVTGWLLFYAADFILGNEAVYEKNHFGGLLGSVSKQGIGTLAALLITVVICIGGVRKTVEKSVKYMMGGLFVLLIILVVQACVQPGAGKGLTFFLAPKFNDFSGSGFFRTLHAAMAQAFFTLSIGIGSIAVCGSYMDKNRSLFQEGLWIILLDTLVAIASGLIIFPSCMAYGVSPDAGPQLIFITLPQVFRNMSYPQVWGALFFIFLAIAALSTLVAVFENLVAFGMDEFHWHRRKSSLIFGIILGILTLPCILGFNLWQNFQPLGEGSTILDLEDFIVSANLLPLGAVYLVFFCLDRSGWGKENCFAELNTGKGWKLTPRITGYIKFVIPAAVLLLWLVGISDIFK